jgi:hypothetical protein
MIIRNIPAWLRKAVKSAANELDITGQELHRRALSWAVKNTDEIKKMEDVR